MRLEPRLRPPLGQSLLYRGALVGQKRADRLVQRGMENPVGAVGQSRLKAPDQLVLPARARFEAGGAPADAFVDRMVEADVEMEEGVLLEATPVAAVENRRRGQVESSREQAAVAPSLHQLDAVLEGREDAAEER